MDILLVAGLREVTISIRNGQTGIAEDGGRKGYFEGMVMIKGGEAC